MSDHILKRIAGVIETKFAGRMDMTDWAGKPATEVQRAFLSRGLAALAIHRLADTDLDEAAKAITDGGDDGSLDAIYYDQTTETIFFVQSKWSADGSKTIDLGSATKFVDGISKIVNDDLSGFNNKVKSAMVGIRPVLFSGIDVKLKLILIHVGVQDVSFHVRQKVIDYISNINTPVKIADEAFYNQGETYKLIIAEHSSQSIVLTISLRQFGFLPKPYLSYYGRVNVNDIAAWGKDNGNNIFSRNLRQLIRRSDINDALFNTINNAPDSFWYLNNGITIICKSAKRAAVNADNTDFGIFHCEGVSVVNGAQTVGVIGEALGLQDPENVDVQNRFRDSWVHVRIIPLDGCPPEFDRRITEATNFQNAVDHRDFAAMDAVQHRLATEFMLDRKKYAYRSGEERPNDEEGCTMVEATQSLACSHSMDLAVQAKREIGLLLI